MSAPAVEVVPHRGVRRRPLPPWWLTALDAALLVGLGVLCAWPLGAAYGERRWLVAVLVGLGLGVAIAFVGALWRWGAWLTALATVAAYLAVGSAVAVPERARGGVVPTADSLRDLAIGLVQAWRQALTLPVLLGSSGVVVLVPLVLGLVAGLVAAVLLWRTRLSALAGLVLGVLLAFSCAFGDVSAQAATLRGLLVAAVTVVWLRWRELRTVRGRWGRRVLSTGLVVGLAGGVAAGVVVATGSAQPRVVLRDHVATPFDPRDYPSPLSKYRYYRKDPVNTGTVLFTVDGIESGTLVRLAVMDSYDGIVWNVSGGPGSAHDSGTFRRLRNAPDANSRASVRGRITVGDYTGVWVPSVGETLALRPMRDGRLDGEAAAELVINRQTGTVAQIGGVRQGTTFEVDADVPRPLDDAEIALLDADGSVSLPTPRIVPEELMDRVQRWEVEAKFTGGTDGQLAQFLRDSFREKGYYSDGVDDLTPAGHGASRLAVLTKTAQPVGNAEQYAAAMALAGQRLGLPIRVVLGFKVPPGEGAVRGGNMLAWTEVKLGDEWVAFEPTPREDQKLRQPDQEPNEDPQPQVLQPPRIPGEPKEADDNLQQGDGRKKRQSVLEVLGAVLAVAYRAGQVGVVTSPLWGVLLFKRRRRRRRRRLQDPSRRLSGAWLELTDRSEDLGVRAPAGATRRERAYAMAERYDAAPVVALAHTADRHVYSGQAPTDAEASAYWADVDSALKRMRRATPWWRRVLARFSLASVPWRAGLERLRGALGRRLRAVGRRVGAVVGRRLGPLGRRLARLRPGRRRAG